MNPIKVKQIVFYTIISVCSLGSLRAQTPAPQEIDPLVKASAYGDKSVYSYSSPDGPGHIPIPLPWTLFHPRDFGPAKVVFDAKGVRSVGQVPAPGVHPRLFFSPEDLPAIRQRIKTDPAAQEAWRCLLSWTNGMKLTYDPTADYAKNRRSDLRYPQGYGGFKAGPSRPDYYAMYVRGEKPEKPAPIFFLQASNEALRCLIEDDGEAAKTLAKATVNAVRFEQERRAKEDKPVNPGQPPNPSMDNLNVCGLGYIYDFIFNWMTPEQQKIIHDELVTLTAWHDNYGTFNNAENSKSNFAPFSYWVMGLMAIEGEPGFNDLKFLGLYRGWRNYQTYGFFENGASVEGEGKLVLGLDGMVVMDRVAPKYGLEPLSTHPFVRKFMDGFAIGDLVKPVHIDGDNWGPGISASGPLSATFDYNGGLGRGIAGGPVNIMIAHYLYPDDGRIDFLYRLAVGNNYEEMPNSFHNMNQGMILSVLYATAFHPENTPEKLKLPLSYFDGQRAVMMTRSSWDTNATFLTMHVRGVSGGHPMPDRNGIMLAGQGQSWVRCNPKEEYGPSGYCTVLIEGAGQNDTTPGRVVDFVEEPEATFMVGDAKYCWDWGWITTERNKQGQRCTRQDVLTNNLMVPGGWELVENSFDDFSYIKGGRSSYFKQPLKFTPHWMAVDGAMQPFIRQVNTPVLKAFRTVGLVRGKHPYVLVVDDVQRNLLPTRYDWNLTLSQDVVQVQGKLPGGMDGDIVLADKASVDQNGAIKTGEPALMIRFLQCDGQQTPLQVKTVKSSAREAEINILTISTRAISPAFKVLMHSFRVGDPLPQTTWNKGKSALSVAFPDQNDSVAFASAPSGKTDVLVSRNGRTIAEVNKPVAPLNDPGAAALDAMLLKQGPDRVAMLEKANYNPLKLPGFVAGWKFDRVRDGAFSPLPGSIATAAPIPIGNNKIEEGMNGRQAVTIGKEGLKGSLSFTDAMKEGMFTVSIWVKAKLVPFCMGNILNLARGRGLAFMQGNIGAYSPGDDISLAGTPLNSWTQVVLTSDGQEYRIYRDGMLIASEPMQEKKVPWDNLIIGGDGGYGFTEITVSDLCFYNQAITPQTAEDLYLWGKYGTESNYAHPNDGRN